MNIYISKKLLKLRSILVFLFVICLALIIDFPGPDTPKISLVTNVEADVGHPASPGSVAGVHRRTRRRTTRRIARGTRVHALPAGCSTVVRNGVKYHSCGGVYYRPYYEGNTVVYVVENP